MGGGGVGNLVFSQANGTKTASELEEAQLPKQLFSSRRHPLAVDSVSERAHGGVGRAVAHDVVSQAEFEFH